MEVVGKVVAAPTLEAQAEAEVEEDLKEAEERTSGGPPPPGGSPVPPRRSGLHACHWPPR